MKVATVFVLCFLLLIAVCAIGQVQSRADSPPVLTVAALPDQVDQATAATVEMGPSLAQAVFTQHWPLAVTTNELMAPELWKAGVHRMGPIPAPLPPFRISQVRNPLGAKLNVDQKARQRI
jgi:Na+-transporting methylmalonyl-CoA/oxaloacetate decarboxylase gamma subunit